MELTRVAVVTGGNRGIGLEVCRQLAARGIRTLLTARREDRGREAARALAEQGLPVSFCPLDVTEEQSLVRLATTPSASSGASTS